MEGLRRSYDTTWKLLALKALKQTFSYPISIPVFGFPWGREVCQLSLLVHTSLYRDTSPISLYYRVSFIKNGRKLQQYRLLV